MNTAPSLTCKPTGPNVEIELFGGELDGTVTPVPLHHGQMPAFLKASTGDCYYPSGAAMVISDDGKTCRTMPRYALQEHVPMLATKGGQQ